METFLSVHQDNIIGVLSTFDRVIFKGHLTGFFPTGAFARFLSRQGVLLKDFKPYVQRASAQLKTHAQQFAAERGRPYQYLAATKTRASGESKEELARAIAAQDGITEGLICVLAAVEPCMTFSVRGQRATQKLAVVREARKCLHFYFYFIDPEFGFMHVRLQSWFPFEMQIYVNGHEWLARQLDQQGVAYERYGNCFPQIADLDRAQQLCERFAHREWPRVLNAFARRLNPLLPTIQEAGFDEYYWVVDQGEIATDVMFRDRASLEAILPDLFAHATQHFAAEDVLRFLGRKLHGNFQGAVQTSLKKRPEGYRVKHWMKRNSIKMYDRWSILRIETTINNPREFKVLKVDSAAEGDTRRWLPMGKGVANFWRYSQVGIQANRRYLEALAHAQPQGEAVQALDDLCRSQVKDGKRYAKFQPVSETDGTLFAAVLAGEHALTGFRNRDLQARLYDQPPATPQEAKRRCARVSRLIAKLRGHGLIAKVKNSRLYRVTQRGYRVMFAALRFRSTDFPQAYLQVAP